MENVEMLKWIIRVKDGKTMVKNELKLKIHEESDMFSPCDPDQSLLSDDVLSVLGRTFIHKHRRLKEDYAIRIISDTPVNEENVRQKIKDYFMREKEDIEFAIRILSKKAICFALLGAVFLGLWYYLSVLKGVDSELLCIVGWVGFWEATDIYIMDRPELLKTRYHLNKLIESEVTFSQSD